MQKNAGSLATIEKNGIGSERVKPLDQTSPHINDIITKANQILGIIRRTFSYLYENTFIKYSMSLEKPSLEYANTICFPNLKQQIIAIEKIQHFVTKILNVI